MLDAATLSALPGLLTWSGLVVFVLIAVIRGWLIPKSSHERELGIVEKRIGELISEKNEWRSAYEAERAVGQEVRVQNRMLLEQGQTSTHALEGIRSSLVQVAKDGAP